MPTPTTTPDSPLISAPALLAIHQAAARDGAPDLLVLDCRFQLAAPDAGQQAYAQGHIDGAAYAHLDHDLSGPKTGLNGRHPLPTPEALAATLGRWGVTPQTQVVAYDDAGGIFAARAWWLLQWLGHARVQVLDGGWAAWEATGGPISAAQPSRTRTQVPAHAHQGWVVTTPEVLAHVQAGDHDAQSTAMRLLDARTAERFHGIAETMDPVGGHIPGARNRWFGLNLQEGGRFKAPRQLQAEFTELLAGQSATTLVHQCGSGVTACHNLLAMAQAGLGMGRLYAGSWSEWCTNPARPVVS